MQPTIQNPQQPQAQVSMQPAAQQGMNTMQVQDDKPQDEQKRSWLPLRLRGGIGPCCAMIDACLCCCALEDICCCGLADLC